MVKTTDNPQLQTIFDLYEKGFISRKGLSKNLKEATGIDISAEALKEDFAREKREETFRKLIPTRFKKI